MLVYIYIKILKLLFTKKRKFIKQKYIIFLLSLYFLAPLKKSVFLILLFKLIYNIDKYICYFNTSRPIKTLSPINCVTVDSIYIY